MTTHKEKTLTLALETLLIATRLYVKAINVHPMTERSLKNLKEAERNLISTETSVEELLDLCKE